MTSPHPARRHAPSADPGASEKSLAETSGPYDPPDPGGQPPARRPAYLIVVDQLRDWQPAQSPSLAELMEPGRTRQLEPDLETEP